MINKSKSVKKCIVCKGNKEKGNILQCENKDVNGKVFLVYGLNQTLVDFFKKHGCDYKIGDIICGSCYEQFLIKHKINFSSSS